MNNNLEIIKSMVDQLARSNIKLLAPIVLELTAKDWNEMSIGIDYYQKSHMMELGDSVSYWNGNIEVCISKKKAMTDDRITELKQELAALEGI